MAEARARCRAAGTITSREPARTRVGTSIRQSRSRDVERLEQRDPLGHDALVGLPAPLDHEIDQRPRLGLAAVQQVEELVDESIVAGQGEPLQDAAGDRRAQRRAEPRLHPLDDQGPEPLGLLDGQLQGDRPAERDAEDGRALQAQLLDQTCPGRQPGRRARAAAPSGVGNRSPRKS